MHDLYGHLENYEKFKFHNRNNYELYTYNDQKHPTNAF